MKMNLFFIFLLLIINNPLFAKGGKQEENPTFDDYFLPKQMRIDIIHTGIDTQEEVSLDEIIEEPYYAGGKKNLIDKTGYGAYLFKVFDLATKRLIYSRGFSSLFGEWQTTDEAKKKIRKAFSESLLFPYPKNKVKVELYGRDKKWRFKKIWEIQIDPSSHLIKRERTFKNVEIFELKISGDPSQKVDIVLIGEGYTIDEKEKFKRDSKRFSQIFFNTSPFKENSDKFNFRAIFYPSPEGGTDEPRKGNFVETILDTSFNTFDSERYLTTANNKKMRNVAMNVPYDTIYLMVNTSRYGGGGIFNLFSVFVSDNEFDEYVFIHEFGHGFAGLGDEYYTSAVSYSDFYPKGVEPWEPNITAQNRREKIKWKDLIEKTTPVPTPPDKEKYEGKIGVFEGAGYSAKGLYRPEIDCKMFSKSSLPFCAVCRKGIEKMIKIYSDSD